jgi:DNA-binding protein Fis
MSKARAQTRKRAGAKAAGAKAAGAHGVIAPRPVRFADFDDRPLHRCVENALNAYFNALDGENTCGLFDLVMAEVGSRARDTGV